MIGTSFRNTFILFYLVYSIYVIWLDSFRKVFGNFIICSKNRSKFKAKKWDLLSQTILSERCPTSRYTLGTSLSFGLWSRTSQRQENKWLFFYWNENFYCLAILHDFRQVKWSYQARKHFFKKITLCYRKIFLKYTNNHSNFF